MRLRANFLRVFNLDRGVTTARRFPSAALGCLIGTAALLMSEKSWFATQAVRETLEHVVGACVFAVMASIAFRMVAEAHRASGMMAAGGQIAALLLAVFIYAFSEEPWVSPAAIAIALIACAASASTSRAPGAEAASWAFNAFAVTRLIFAVICAALLALGLLAIFHAIAFLFGVVEARTFGNDAALAALTFILPMLWLSLLPPRTAELPAIGEDLPSRALVLTGTLVAVLVLFYAGVLHLYAVKIAVQGSLPQNEVGWMASTFLLTGYLAFLAVYPAEGPFAGMRRRFRQVWFLTTMVPAGLLVVAVWQRVEAYGITPERWALILIAALSVTLVAMQAVRPGRMDIRLVPAAALCFALLTSVGPLTMSSVSIRSQFARLEAFLLRDGIWDNGRFTGLSPALARSDLESAVSMIRVLGDLDGLGALEPLVGQKFADTSAALAFFKMPGAFASARDYVRVDFSFRDTAMLAGRLIGPFTVASDSQGMSGSGVEVRLQGNVVTLVQGAVETRIDLKPVADRYADIAAKNETGQPAGADVPAAVEAEDGSAVLRLLNATLHRNEAGPYVVSIEAIVLMKEPVQAPPPDLQTPMPQDRLSPAP